MSIGPTLLIALTAFVYLFPSIIGYGRRIKHPGLLLVGNLLFGVSILGWFIALVYAFAGDARPAPPPWPVPPRRSQRVEPFM